MELHVVRNGVILHALPLSEQPLYIGRGPENDVVVPEQTVSSNHASVWMESGQVWLKDLGSRNGTFVNDNRIQGATPVNVGDSVRLGPDMELRVHGAGAPSGPPLAYLVEDTTSGLQFPLRSDRFTIGGSEDDNLPIPGAEAQALTIIVYPDGEVYLGDAEGEERAVEVGASFEVAGHTLRLLALSPTYTATIEAEPARYPYILKVTLDGVSGPEAVLYDDQNDRSHRVDAENRAVLLYVLGKQWLDDRASGKPRPERGWCSDADVSTGIWGRKGTADANALHVLTHRLRRELKKAGFDPWFIEKRRRALRIRIKDVQIA
jgi:hypothetical protein